MAFSGSPGRSGRIGAVRSSAWICDFSSTHNTTAFSGGFRYNPMMSRTLASSSGSVENLNVCRRQGWTPYRRQARATVASPIPSCRASSRVDQWVTANFWGGGSSVAVMMSSSATVLGRPDLGASPNASIPSCANRTRHWITVGRETPSRRAIALVPSPSAAANTILARITRPARIEDDRDHDTSVARS